MKDIKICIEEYGDDQWMVCYTFTLRGKKMETLGVAVDMYKNAELDYEGLGWAIDQSRAELEEKHGLMVDTETNMVQ